jgi:hypothetical protein
MMTSWFKSANTCNFEGCPKLKTSNFQWWQFFISYPNVKKKILKMSNLKPFSAAHQVEFSKI